MSLAHSAQIKMNIMKRISARILLCAMSFASIALLPSCVKADLTIASQSKSTFAIVVPANAPGSVQEAANELQKDIQLSTGAKLPLQKDDAEVTTFVISLGNTQQAKAAGISSATLADEAFRIVTQNGNLYILGNDTPDGKTTPYNGVSNGTANGVYTFLEDYLGVRWLMPGDIGRDVPAKSTFTLDDINRAVTPEFSLRHMGHLWDYDNAAQRKKVEQWKDHLKLGGATKPPYNHNFWRTVNGNNSTDVHTAAVQKLYKEHPTWFAMNAAGQRPAPQRKYNKLETTNPELVQWFAEQAIKKMKESGVPTYSLSPSDGTDWSQSPESKALYDPSPSTLFDPEAPAGQPGTSSLVLKWYHDVAQIVAKEYPQGRLGGYIYSTYLYPPSKFTMKLPENFWPTIAMSPSYGFGLYRPDTQKVFEYVMDSWAKVAPENWYYYDLPNLMFRQHPADMGITGKAGDFPGSTAIVTPAAPDILNRIFRSLHRNHIKGTILYGTASWSNGALANYIMAKMDWDPTLNADDVQREWLQRAYGPKAGAAMQEFYEQLNNWYSDYYQKHNKASYRLTLDMLKNIYAAHYPAMEKLFLQAKAQPMTEPQQQRLQLIEDNLIALQWRLRNAELWPAGVSSQLQRDNAQVIDLLTQENPDFNLFPGAVNSAVNGWAKPKAFPWKVLLDSSATPAKSTFTKLDDGQFLLYAARDGEIRITPQRVSQSAWFASYEIQNQDGAMVASGILNTGTPIVFPAKAGQVFYLYMPPRRAVNYALQIADATLASAQFANKTVTLSGKPAAVYVYAAPQGVPIGVVQDGNAVAIKKPYSGGLGDMLMKSYTDKRVLYSFDEDWRFSPDPQNDGLQRGVAQAKFDDSSWKKISVLNWWQLQGFADYHGAAWYRITFTKPELKEGARARLLFGAVDGNTEVYLNGKKINEHLLGPDYDGWNKPFSMDVTHKMQAGENILAVKVTSKNDTSSSGIFKGVALVAGVPVKK